MPKITILPDHKTVEVKAGTTLLQASMQAGALHGSACGGVGACSSCHVWVHQGLDSLTPASDNELDILDQVFGSKPNSRLGCQAKVKDQDVTFEITPESLQTWLNEHPSQYRSIQQGQLPPEISAELEARLKTHLKK